MEESRPIVSPNSPSQKGNLQAGREVWNWKHDTESSDGAGRHLRREGVLRALAGCVIAVLFLFFGHSFMASVVLLISGITLLSAIFFSETLYRGIHVMVERLAGWIGRLLSWILLPLMFFGIMLPLGLLIRRGRSRRIPLRTDPSRQSYWDIRQEGRPAASSYERQF